jgi:hypothetical protein
MGEAPTPEPERLMGKRVPSPPRHKKAKVAKAPSSEDHEFLGRMAARPAVEEREVIMGDMIVGD